jgi:hypothetical protein
VQSGTTSCTGSDGSTASTPEVCGAKPATPISRSCTPTGCGTSGGGGGGADHSDSSSSGPPLLWIGVGAGGGAALIALTIALVYFCYVKPRRNLIKPLEPTATAPLPQSRASGLPSAAAPYAVTGRPGGHWETTRGRDIQRQGMPVGADWEAEPNAYAPTHTAVNVNNGNGSIAAQPAALDAQQQWRQRQQQRQHVAHPSRAVHVEPMFVEQL